MNKPNISIIIPIYNMEKTLPRTLDSLANQSYRDFEVIMVNDGSKDNSGTICDHYAKIYSNFYSFHKLNGGVSSARNKGLSHAKGKWVTFCDADDFVLPNYLDNFILHSENTNLVVQGIILSKDSTTIGLDYHGTIKEGLIKLLELHIVGYTVNKLFLLDLIHQHNISFNERFTFREDEDFVLKYLSIAKNITCTNKGGYIYDIPDFENKYSKSDNFYTSCSMYSSIKKILGNRFGQYHLPYLTEATNALFHAFDDKKEDRVQRVSQYQLAVGKDFIHAPINFLSKLLLYFNHNPKFISYFFDIKSSIKLNKH